MFNSINSGKWWDEGLELIAGCTPINCTGCWAAMAAHTRQFHPNKKIADRYSGLTIINDAGIPEFNGQIRIFENALNRPLSKKEPTAYSIWEDLFHYHVPNSTICHTFDMFAKADHHIFFVLTQRIERAWKFLSSYYENQNINPLRNVIIGTTIRTQKDIPRATILSDVPAAARIISIEPLLEYICLTQSFLSGNIDGIIIGGPTGKCPGIMDPYWVTSLIDAASFLGVNVFFKSWGNWSPNENKNTTFQPINQNDKLFYKIPRGTIDRIVDGKIFNQLPIEQAGNYFKVKPIIKRY